MKLALMQPYFFPYIGYFQLIHAVDTFVIYDDVKYINDGWIHRNRILINGAPAYINLPLKKGSHDAFINEREVSVQEIARAKAKILGQLQATYKKLPQYNDVVGVIELILDYPDANLALFLKHAIERICRYLHIDTPIVLSSGIEKNDAHLKGQDRVIALCKAQAADVYINSIGGQALYSGRDFADQGIALRFIKTGDIHYSQPTSIFVPHLSIIDVMMCNDVESVQKMLAQYQLIESV